MSEPNPVSACVEGTVALAIAALGATAVARALGSQRRTSTASPQSQAAIPKLSQGGWQYRRWQLDRTGLPSVAVRVLYGGPVTGIGLHGYCNPPLPSPLKLDGSRARSSNRHRRRDKTSDDRPPSSILAGPWSLASVPKAGLQATEPSHQHRHDSTPLQTDVEAVQPVPNNE